MGRSTILFGMSVLYEDTRLTGLCLLLTVMDYRDPGADHYEQQYREPVIKQLHRRAA